MVYVCRYRARISGGIDAEGEERIIDRGTAKEGGEVDGGGADCSGPHNNRVAHEGVAPDNRRAGVRADKRAQEEDQGQGPLLTDCY